MIRYRIANPADAPLIAETHAISWKRHYKGIVTDHYLNSEVDQDRLQVWQERFSSTNPQQHIVIAEEDGIICGFGCAYTNYHDEWGSYLDNLHVLREHQRKGIGYQLLKRTAKAVSTDHPSNRGYYLWVLRDNLLAIAFYKRAGGVARNQASIPSPDGGTYPCIRFSWDLDSLI